MAILPYYIGAASLFLGAYSKMGDWIAVGAIVMFGLWIAGYLLKRQG